MKKYMLSARESMPSAVSLEIIDLHSYGGLSGEQQNQGCMQKQNLCLEVTEMD